MKKITNVDDTMIHNLVKYPVWTRLRLWNLLFLYLIIEVEFGQNILQDYVSSYHLNVWFFLVNLNNIFAVVCIDFHEIVVSTRYVPIL